MTVKDVGYPIGVTVDTATGLISGRPLPTAVEVNLTGLTLKHTQGVPDWSPTVLTLTYRGFGLVYPGYHQWGVKIEDGTYTREAIVTFNPSTGDTSVQALTYPTATHVASWYAWARTNLNPFGSYTTPFTTSGVVGASVVPATVSARPSMTYRALPTADWFGFWDLTTAVAAPVVAAAGVGPLTYFGSRTPATFSAVDAAWLFDPSAGTEWMGCANVTPVSTTKLTLGMLVKNIEATPALPIIEIGPAFESTENALSGNVTATYFYTPSVNEAFSAAQILSDNTWHWVVLTVDYTTKVVKLYVDGKLHATLVSAYAHASISIGSVFIHAWDNQNCLIKTVFAATSILADADIAALSAYEHRWIGAWDMEGARADRVSGAPGGSFNVSGYSGYTLSAAVAGGPFTSLTCIELPSTAGASFGHGAQVSPAQTLTAFTMSAWLKGDAAGHAPNLRIFRAINDSANSANLTVGLNNVYIGGASYTVPVEPADANWHHYAMTWNGADGDTRVYVDGNLVWSGLTLIGTVTCGWCGFDAATVELNGFGDLFALHRDVLPLAAIRQLAAGKLPDSQGLLPVPSSQINITAANSAGSDTKALLVDGSAPEIAYQYWRITITDIGTPWLYAGLVLNEIAGYAAADGSGTNLFAAAQGATCASSGGYSGSPPESQLLDGVLTDSATLYAAIGAAVNGYFQITLPTAQVIRRVNLYYCSGTYRSGIKLQASNDGANWVDKSAQVFVAAAGRPTIVDAQ